MIPNKTDTYYSVSSKWSIQYTVEQSKEMMKLHFITADKKKPYLLFFLGVKIVIVSNAFIICVCFLGGEAGCFWVGRYVPYQSWFQYIYSSHYTWSPGCRLYAYSERKDLGRWKFKTNQHWFWADRPTEDLNPRKWINLIGKKESEELREYIPLEMEGLTAIVLYQVRLPIKQVTE